MASLVMGTGFASASTNVHDRIALGKNDAICAAVRSPDDGPAADIASHAAMPISIVRTGSMSSMSPSGCGVPGHGQSVTGNSTGALTVTPARR